MNATHSAPALPSLPTVRAYDLEPLLDGCIPEPIRCDCGVDVSYRGYRVNRGSACCRECAIERVCEVLGEHCEDDVTALAVECVDGAL